VRSRGGLRPAAPGLLTPTLSILTSPHGMRFALLAPQSQLSASADCLNAALSSATCSSPPDQSETAKFAAVCAGKHRGTLSTTWFSGR
jgi:hypothetical protein